MIRKVISLFVPVMWLTGCATRPMPDPATDGSLGNFSMREIRVQWEWLHSPQRRETDFEPWETRERCRSLVQQAAFERLGWSEPVRADARAGFVRVGDPADMVYWSWGPPAGTVEHRVDGSVYEKWVGQPSDRNFSWIVLLKDGLVIQIERSGTPPGTIEWATRPVQPLSPVSQQTPPEEPD